MNNTLDNPRAFVIGWPISHSKSPIIHTHWLKQYGLDGSYEKIAVEPDKLGEFLAKLKTGEFAGGNVTIPHKEALFDHVDVIHSTAKALMAANTLWMEDGKLHADNTDGFGFLANLDQNCPDWDKKEQKSALILGAGGACKPIVNGLLKRGFKNISLVNRTRKRAEDIAKIFDDIGYKGVVEVADWEKRERLCENIDLLVNTTALGMTGQPSLEINLDCLPQTALVTDIVYAPLKTGLLIAAEKRGNRIVDGLGMLLHQAVPGFEKWFGVRPTVTNELRNLVLGAKS